MKKCFLLISIILVAFGFSLNSSVISNSQNKQTTNPNSSNIYANENVLITIKTPTTYPSANNKEGKTTINYSIEDASKSIKELTWTGMFTSGIQFENTTNIQEDRSHGDKNKFSYNGCLTQKRLLGGEEYTNIIGGYDNKGKTYATDSFTFTIPEVIYEGKVEKTSENININDDQQTATIDYKITPATMKIDNAESEEKIEPLKIEWVDSVSGNVLASEINDDEDVNIWEDGYSGSLTTKSLVAGEYKTKLVVTDEKNYTYESLPITFTIKELGGTTKSGEVKQAVGSEITTTYDTATIDYEITPATTNGELNTPTKIMWVDGDNGGTELGGEGNASISNDNGIPLSSADNGYKSLTATNLEQGGYENTYLEVTDKEGGIYTCNETFEIKTEPSGETEGEIISLGTTDEIKEDEKYKATVNYKIIPANDDDGNANKVTKIQWINKENGDNSVLATKETSTKEIPLEGEDAFLTTDELEAGKKYENTYLEVTDKNDGFYEPTRVQTFWAANGDENGEITANSKIKSVDEESATIDYTIDPAKDIFEKDNTPTKIMWVDSDGNELGGEGNANISNEEGIPLSEKDEGYEPLTATNLKPGTPYENTHLEVTDSNNGKYNETNSIEKFVTVSAYDKGTIWKEGEIKTTGNSATITYGMTRTYNDQGNQFLPEKVKWYAIINGDETLIASETPDSADGGEMTTDIFLPTNITYEKTYLVMEDNYQSNEDNGGDLHDNPKSETFELNTGNFKTRDMIIGGSAIAIVLFIIAVILFFFWAYKKRRRVN